MAKHNNTPEKPKMAPEEALFQALSLCRKAGALTWALMPWKMPASRARHGW